VEKEEEKVEGEEEEGELMSGVRAKKVFGEEKEEEEEEEEEKEKKREGRARLNIFD